MHSNYPTVRSLPLRGKSSESQFYFGHPLKAGELGHSFCCHSEAPNLWPVRLRFGAFGNDNKNQSRLKWMAFLCNVSFAFGCPLGSLPSGALWAVCLLPSGALWAVCLLFYAMAPGGEGRLLTHSMTKGGLYNPTGASHSAFSSWKVSSRSACLISAQSVAMKCRL